MAPLWERIPGSDVDGYAIRARAIDGSLTSIAATIVRGDGCFETYFVAPNGLTAVEADYGGELADVLRSAEVTLRQLGWDLEAIVAGRRLN